MPIPLVPLPPITIVIPAFNHERHVAQAFDSCLDSGLPDVEIIACDDASTDATAAIIDDWMAAHPNFKLAEKQCREIHPFRLIVQISPL